MLFNYSVTSALFAMTASMYLAGSIQAAPVYTVREIKAPDGIATEEARAISNHGRLIVGHGPEADDPKTTAPFITKRRRAQALEQPCDRITGDKECDAWPAGVNDSGEAVGTMSVGPAFQNRYFAQYWDKEGRVVDLDAQIPCDKKIKHTYGSAINDQGTMLVILDCATSGRDWVKTSFVYQNGQLTPIGSIGFDETSALAINNRDQVVGYGKIDGSDHHSFVWENGVTRDLGDIDGSQKNIATDINDLGHAIVGTTGTGWIGKNYIIDVATGAKQLIAHCHGGDGPSPMAINNRDEVALSDGRSESWLYTGGECHAFVDLLDDSSHGWTDLVVTDIDDEGVVVGHGYHHKEHKAFIAKPASASR